MLDSPFALVTASSIAAAQVLTVANIDSPGTELNARAGVSNGATCIVTQNVAGANAWTLYQFDATSSAGVNSPYIVAALTSGQWIAVAGKYVNSALNVTGAITSVSTVQGTQLISTIATGTAPFTVASTTQVTNLNASQLIGGTWAIPGSIGATTPNAGAFTTLTASGIVTWTNTTDASAIGTAAEVLSGGLSVAKQGRFGTSVTVGGAATSLIDVTTPTSGNDRSLTFTDTAGSRFNWKTGACNARVTDAYEITPSTAAGGSTFSVPAIQIYSNGFIQMTRTAATTTSAFACIQLANRSTGTPAAGFGVSFLQTAQDSTTNDVTMSNTNTVWVDATHVSRKARQVYEVYDTAAREAFRVEATGTAPAIGFLGATASARITFAAWTGSATRTSFATSTATLANVAEAVKAIIDDLRTFGLYG